MTAPATVLIAGATGLVGGAALARLLEHPAVASVETVGRRPLSRSHPRIRERVVDFATIDAQPPAAASAAICALGTTIKAAGSQAAFRAVDHDAVVGFARWARRSGAETFALVSSVGADPHARGFYLRVKGEAEAAVRAIGFPTLVVLRPSLLLGPRTERRPGEALARALAPALAPLMVGGLRRYRAISADLVAGALVRAVTGAAPGGATVWEHDEIVAAAGKS